MQASSGQGVVPLDKFSAGLFLDGWRKLKNQDRTMQTQEMMQSEQIDPELGTTDGCAAFIRGHFLLFPADICTVDW